MNVILFVLFISKEFLVLNFTETTDFSCNILIAFKEYQAIG